MNRHETDIRTEVLGGITTFLAMSFIVFVNPIILGQAGMPVAAVAVATCLVTGIATIMMGLIANVPLALAPGMGLTVYFSVTVVQQMHVPWPVALGYVFMSGVAFLVLTLSGIRQKIVAAVPPHLYAAVSGGIGLFIGSIGLKDAGFIIASPYHFVALGDLRTTNSCLALFTLTLMATLAARGVRGSILIGVVATTAIAAMIGKVSIPRTHHSVFDLHETFLRLDLPGGLHPAPGHGLGIIEIVFVFLFVDLFDNIATLMTVTKRAGLLTPDGRLPHLNRMLLVDSLATMLGACLGTSTVTTYVESASGVQAGGRTGLTAVVTGMLFLATTVVASYASMVPLAATSPTLILVGALMMAPLSEIRWSEPADAIPASLTIILIPLAYSIANGLAIGIIGHVVCKILRWRLSRDDLPAILLAGLFTARFIYLAGN